jgi:hypothetical protein
VLDAGLPGGLQPAARRRKSAVCNARSADFRQRSPWQN